MNSRSNYGYRWIAALLKRERRSAGHGPANAKRVYRLMKKAACCWSGIRGAACHGP
ncbi:IS3 family transposase [Bradyrhizobium macuxiense]|uniref:IS3 family transposase n=1 Tax=Bradyrhizobium macuxiense TaxID=1755647 RepID=UPI0009EBF9C8